MKISTILDHIDSGHMALPGFNVVTYGTAIEYAGCSTRFISRYPVGELLVWVTESKTAAHRGDAALPAGVEVAA